MEDAPRQWLQEIVTRYGRDVLHDPRRCRALLMDFCGEYRGEINVLEMALREGIVEELETASAGVPQALLFARLTRRLQDVYYLPEEAARWAVESCAAAVDLVRPEEGGRALVSDLQINVVGRPWLGDEDDWVNLGTTPGRVDVPGDVEVQVSAYVKDPQAGRLARDLVAFGPVDNLDLSYSPITDRGLAQLKDLAGVRHLNLSRTRVTDHGMPTVAAYSELVGLNLWACAAISGDGLRHLADLEAFTGLNLGRCERLTDAGLRHLPALVGIRDLNLTGTAVTDGALGYLGALPDLHEVDLAETDVNGAGLRELRGAAELATLSLYRCVALRSDSLRHLQEMRRLTRLNLGGCGLLTNQALVHLRSLAGLTRLSLEGVEITDAGVLYLGSLTALMALDLSWTRVGDAGVGRLAPLVGLRELALAGTAITDLGLRYLDALPGLTYLDLSNTGVGDAGARTLARVAPTLVTLDLEGTEVEDGALRALGGLPRLEHLYLGDTAVTDAGLAALAAGNSLRRVDLTLCPNVTAAAVATLEEKGIQVDR
jgi:Leucine-rich repeat (LRR) protein